MAQSISEAGSSAQAGKIEMHALGGVCAGEARVAASVPEDSIGHNEVVDLPVCRARRQVIMTAHFLRSTFGV